MFLRIKGSWSKMERSKAKAVSKRKTFPAHPVSPFEKPARWRTAEITTADVPPTPRDARPRMWLIIKFMKACVLRNTTNTTNNTSVHLQGQISHFLEQEGAVHGNHGRSITKEEPAPVQEIHPVPGPAGSHALTQWAPSITVQRWSPHLDRAAETNDCCRFVHAGGHTAGMSAYSSEAWYYWTAADSQWVLFFPFCPVCCQRFQQDI